jgi:hypothetical protein
MLRRTGTWKKAMTAVTLIHDATVEEEKKRSNPGKTINHMGDTKKVTWAK